MKIETKFDIGQEVFVVKQYKKEKHAFEEPEKFYKIENYIVVSIYASVHSSRLLKNDYYFLNCYRLSRYGFEEDFMEEQMFATKEEAEERLKELEEEK